MWGMSPIDQMICRIEFRRASYQGIFTPPTDKPHYIEYPGYNGGSDWGGVAVDPERGIIIANYNDMPNYDCWCTARRPTRWAGTPRERPVAGIGGVEGAGVADRDTLRHPRQCGMAYAGPGCCDAAALWRHPRDRSATGKTLWDRSLGSARPNGPFGIPSMLPITIGTPNNGGSVVTAGGLIFIAAATDDLIHAIDIESGKTVWRPSSPPAARPRR